jgi:hypothetical protein
MEIHSTAMQDITDRCDKKLVKILKIIYEENGI